MRRHRASAAVFAPKACFAGMNPGVLVDPKGLLVKDLREFGLILSPWYVVCFRSTRRLTDAAIPVPPPDAWQA